MEGKWELVGEGKQLIQLIRSPEKGDGGGRVSPVLSVGDVCRLLHRSRRQVYRYIHRGSMKPCAHILGQWLFAKEEVERFQRERLPASFRPLFWDARLSDIDPGQHRDLILSRILEYGDTQAVRWALEKYRRREWVDFLTHRGARLLSARSWHFWVSYFRLRRLHKRRPPWQLHKKRYQRIFGIS